MGRWVLKTFPPLSNRILFPLLISWDLTEKPEKLQYWNARWVRYQILRFLFIWASLYVLAKSFGLAVSLVSAGLFGLTYRIDYWSNTVELLAASLAVASLHLDLHWGIGVAAGLVLGTGRETLPLLALLATPFSVALGLSAGISQLIVRSLARPDPSVEHRRSQVRYGWDGGWKLRWNLSLFTSWNPIDQAGLTVYIFLVAASFFISPALSLGVLCVTLPFTQINEARVATMLVPLAARTLCGT